MHHILAKLIEFGVEWLFDHEVHPVHGKRRRVRSWVPLAVVSLGMVGAAWHGSYRGALVLEPRLARLETKVDLLTRIFAGNQQNAAVSIHQGAGPWIESAAVAERR